VAAQADQATWDKLRQMAKAATSELERRELYQLLGSAESDELTRQALALTLTDEIPPTIRPNVFRSAAQRHPEATLDFAIAHWDRVSALLETSSAQLFLPRLAANSADLKTIETLQKFADTHAPAGARQEYVLAIARVRYSAKIRATRLPEVDRWLAANPLQLRATASMLLPSGSSTKAP
jgi:aminopeptidase N